MMGAVLNGIKVDDVYGSYYYYYYHRYYYGSESNQKRDRKGKSPKQPVITNI